MASKAQLESDLRTYDRLKETLHTCYSYLTGASSNINLIKPTLDNHYSINDNSGNITTKSTQLCNSIIETSNCIKNNVIPAINQAQDNIRREMARIEEEERRAEEEAREAAAAARTQNSSSKRRFT